LFCKNNEGTLLYIFDNEDEKDFYGLFKPFFVYLYMASRESFAIKNAWKHPNYARHRHGRTYPMLNTYSKREQTILRIKSVWYFTLRRFIQGDKWSRKMFIKDNITIPFNKMIGCKLKSGHKWYYMDDEEYAFCERCHKKTGHITWEVWNRTIKLKSIKKRIK